MNETSKLTSEEKLWAALAHGSALIFFFGTIVSAVVWFTQRKHSAFVRFHALQAMAYQAISVWLWTVLMPIIMIVMMILLIATVPLTRGSSQAEVVWSGLFPLVIWGMMFGAFGIYFLVGLIGAVSTLTGHDFHYPLLGGRLARYLEYSLAPKATISEEKEDFVAASVAHSTCILTLWGIFTPLVLWITQKDRSPFLRFQALQATVYQAVGAAAYIIWTAVYLVAGFAMMGLGLLAEPVSSGTANSSGAAIAMLLFFIPMLCMIAALFLIAPLYQLFGFIASLRVLQGKDYKYPILGRILARRMEPQASPAQEPTQ